MTSACTVRTSGRIASVDLGDGRSLSVAIHGDEEVSVSLFDSAGRLAGFTSFSLTGCTGHEPLAIASGRAIFFPLLELALFVERDRVVAVRPGARGTVKVALGQGEDLPCPA